MNTSSSAGGDSPDRKTRPGSPTAEKHGHPPKAVPGYGIHWHVMLTHFPVSFFMISAGFMALHLLTGSACFELTTYICLAAGAGAILPATATGWLAWKRRYRGARTMIFLRKLRISWCIIALSLFLVTWRTLFPTTTHTLWHYLYSGGIFLLFIGVSLEGFYGGRLNHR